MRALFVLVAVVFAAGAAHPAVGQERPLTLSAGATVSWDDNVYRLPDSAPAPLAAQGYSGKSDRITNAFVGLRFAQQWSRQNVSLDVTQSAARYAHFTKLDHDSLNYTAGWNLQVGRHLTGSLASTRSQNLVNLQDVTGLQRVVQTSTANSANLDGWLVGGWHLLGGISNQRRRNSATFLAQPNSDQTGGNVGLRYVAGSQSSITLEHRRSTGTYVGQTAASVSLLGTGYTTRETELSVAWNATGKSTLTGNVLRTEQQVDNLAGRDFSGTGGGLTYAWTPTGKLTLNFSAQRAVMPWTADTTGSYRVDETISIAPTWQVSDRIAVRMRALRVTTDFRGALTPLAGPPRRDVVSSAMLGVDWMPYRDLTLAATVQSERRTSTGAAFEYSDSVASVSASYTF